MTDKHCESVNECANGELCAMLKNSAGLTLVGCSHFKPKQPTTNEEWLRSATFEEMAGAIYEWHTKGYARGRLEVDLNPITEVVEWLKQPHTTEER